MGQTTAKEFVDVPGDTTLWKTQDIPPQRIDLPLEVGGRFRWYYPIFGIAALLALSSSIKFYFVAVQNWELGNSLDRMAWVAGVIGCLFVSVLFAGMLVRMIVDAANSLPLLILTRETLWDQRQLDKPIQWSDVERIRFQSVRDTTVLYLKLAQPVYVRSGLFRVGGAIKSGLRSNIVVLLSDLEDEDLVEKVIVALAKKAEI
ncbi:STM3941 family protein [Mesorhizobium sp. M7A.F.Ca.US.010.02.1.1]|uniref:STM3941 family protein n=1 Tax=unclassified Mesorhizobium TaxID=325217 RepID=UPI000FD6117D|nr:STM3941 family protein [Mesorhizobium sp. M7A.F.Ca.US.010.02.1.1]RUW93563.1 hypothetical protein EOA19_05700 [Mesorhizobium sp. M7A.F.Ca.US.010.02.1.1]